MAGSKYVLLLSCINWILTTSFAGLPKEYQYFLKWQNGDDWLKKILPIVIMLTLFVGYSSNTDIDRENITKVESKITISETTEEILPVITYEMTNEQEKDEIDKIIDFIKTERICYWLFYDFNKDNYPELIEAREGEYFCDYILYDLKGEITQYIGVLSADTMTNTTNILTLYFDNDLNEYFYFAKTYFIFNGTNLDDEFYLWVYKINDGQITSDCVGKYTGDWDGKKYWYKDIHFMDTKIEDGYYDENEINTLLGIDEYLSQFEKIKEVNLEPQWINCDDDNLESKVREELKKYPYFNQ